MLTDAHAHCEYADPPWKPSKAQATFVEVVHKLHNYGVHIWVVILATLLLWRARALTALFLAASFQVYLPRMLAFAARKAFKAKMGFEIQMEYLWVGLDVTRQHARVTLSGVPPRAVH
jgi:hypothetical protein